eukprot:293420-Amphidinium_carterae.1
MQQFAQVASETDFVMSENLRVLAQRYFCGVTHTKHVEDAVRSNRLAEISRSGCRQLSSIRAWHTLVSERVPNLLHRFDSGDKARIDVPRGFNASTIHQVSLLQPGICSAFLRKQVTSTARPSWHSPSPAMAVVEREDAALVEYCAERNLWQKAEKGHWAAVLTNGENLAIRSTREPNALWLLSLGTRSGMSTMVWPLKELKVPTKTFYVLDLTKRPYFKPVLGVNNFESFTIVWKGPLALRAEMKAPPKRPVLGCVNGTVQSLLCTSAEQGFWQLPKSQLLHIMRQAGVTVPPASSLVSVLETLYRHAFPKCKDSDVADMLQRRLQKCLRPTRSIDWDVCEELVEKSDKQEIVEVRRTAKTDEETVRTIREKTQVLRPAASKRKSGVSSSSGAQGKVSEGTRTYPKSVPKPSDAVTVAVLEPLLPPGYSIYADDLEKRWLLTKPGLPSVSRSWSLYGFNQSARECLLAAWHEYTGGQPGAMPFKLPEW